MEQPNFEELSNLNRKIEMDLNTANIRNVEKHFKFSRNKWTFDNLQESPQKNSIVLKKHRYLMHYMSLLLLAEKKVSFTDEVKKWLFLREKFPHNKKYFDVLKTLITKEKEKAICLRFAHEYPWTNLSVSTRGLS